MTHDRASLIAPEQTVLGLASSAASRIIDNTACTALPKTPPPQSCAPHTQLIDDGNQALPKEERLKGSQDLYQGDFFRRERDLLLCDIAEVSSESDASCKGATCDRWLTGVITALPNQSLEELLNHTNALNRNLEELLRVRHFIDESSALYNAFARIMTELVRTDWQDQGTVGASHGL